MDKEKIYFWHDGVAWQLARKTGERDWYYNNNSEVRWDCQVQHLYSNRLEWVPESLLEVYHVPQEGE